MSHMTADEVRNWMQTVNKSTSREMFQIMLLQEIAAQLIELNQLMKAHVESVPHA